MNVQEIANVQIGLQAVPASQASFNVPLVLVDHADIPIDKRFTITQQTSFLTDFTASTSHLAWLTALWGQDETAQRAYVGRWVSAASAAYMVFPDATQDAAVYAALTSTGQMKITEGVLTEDINPDFTGDTSMANVAASVQVALAASVNFSSYTCTIDQLGRLVITSDNTGASADAVSASSPAAGTDLTGALYFGTEFSQAGLDAEALETAMAAILQLDNTPFLMAQIGGSISQVVAFSTAVNALDKFLFLTINDTDASDSSSTTDAAYQIGQLSHQKTHMSYTEHSAEYPDATIIGSVMQRLEGSASVANSSLSGISSKSGLGADGSTVIPLTPAQISALEAKGCDFIISPSTITHMRNGLAAGGNEVRLMVGKAFMAAKISEAVYAYLIANDVVTYSDEDIQAIKGLVDYWASVMVDRKTIEAGYTITMPLASSFTAAQKATHTMALSNILTATAQSSVNDMTITMSFTI